MTAEPTGIKQGRAPFSSRHGVKTHKKGGLRASAQHVGRAGTWYDADGKRRRATQYHEVMGYWGGPFMKYTAQTLVAVHLVGTATAQIIACSGPPPACPDPAPQWRHMCSGAFHSASAWPSPVSSLACDVATHVYSSYSLCLATVPAGMRRSIDSGKIA